MSRKEGFKHSAETRLRMSLAQKGKPNKRKGIPGKKHTVETLLKLKVLSKERWNKLEEKIKVSGPNSKFWKGGRFLHVSGYIVVTHPIRGWEHRIVMEKHLGRKLLRTEVVHHINEDKTDNRIENLELFANQKEHLAHHDHISPVFYRRGQVNSPAHREKLRQAMTGSHWSEKRQEAFMKMMMRRMRNAYGFV
jgi:hypothetical protein